MTEARDVSSAARAGVSFFEKMVNDEREGIVAPEVNVANIRHRLGLYTNGHRAALESTKDEVIEDYTGDVMYLLHRLGEINGEEIS